MLFVLPWAPCPAFHTADHPLCRPPSAFEIAGGASALPTSEQTWSAGVGNKMKRDLAENLAALRRARGSVTFLEPSDEDEARQQQPARQQGPPSRSSSVSGSSPRSVPRRGS